MVAKDVWYYSPGDENAFFAWLRGLHSVLNVCGVGSELQIVVRDNPIPDDELRELIAVFFRYEIEMTQLALFLNEHNAHWFKQQGMFWHSKVFPSG